jgi:hypothetical protein
MTKEQVLGVFRHVLTFVGGIIMAKGLIDEALVNEIIGTIVTVIGTTWSIVTKPRKNG